jgi:thymidylate synthase (FAD)
MKIIDPYYTIITEIDYHKVIKNLEQIGRICYKSEDKITNDSAESFIRMLIKNGHESVLEHEKLSVLFINDRGVSHEEVRHRLASFSQESTRFINYTKENRGGEIAVINIYPHLINPLVSHDIWESHMIACETAYMKMIDAGEKPEIARSVLPNSLKTEIVITANIREWRTIFKQRTIKAAHPQIREVMIPLLDELIEKLPVLFEDLK